MLFDTIFYNLKNIIHVMYLLFPECRLDVECVLDDDFEKTPLCIIGIMSHDLILNFNIPTPRITVE